MTILEFLFLWFGFQEIQQKSKLSITQFEFNIVEKCNECWWCGMVMAVGVGKLMTKLFSGKYALVSNTLSGGILFAIGDIIQQNLEKHQGLQKKIDNERLKRITTIGLLEGPPHHYFYKYLDVLLPGRTAAVVTKKILIDQLVASPFFNVQFFCGMSYLEGHELKECWNEFLKKFPSVYIVDWCLWPPCQLINFWLIPSKYRVLYVNTVTVLWNVFLSYMKHYDKYDILPPIHLPPPTNANSDEDIDIEPKED